MTEPEASAAAEAAVRPAAARPSAERPSWSATVRPGRANVLLAAMALSTFLFVLTEGMPYGLLRFMGADLAATDSQIGLLVTGYAIIVFLTSVPLALLTKRLPRRLVLAIVVALAALATAGAGIAANYSMVLASRLVTALAQALFWVAVLPGTAGLFPPPVRGRVLARLAVGNALAPVLGLPAVTWVAAHFGWRTSFLLVSGLGLAVFGLVLALFPPVPSDEVGATPTPYGSRRRFWFLLAETALLVAGAFGLITFITTFLLDVGGHYEHHTPPLLMGYGLGGLIGALAIARLIDRAPWTAMLAGAIALGVLQLALWFLGASRLLSVIIVVLFGFSFAGMPPTLTQRAMLCFPGSTDVGTAAASGTFNLGIAAGSAIGAGLVAAAGVRLVPLVGAILMALAVAVALVERRICGPEPRSDERGPSPAN